MTDDQLAELVAQEIGALHVEFEAWFRGESQTLSRVEAALALDFTHISPAGTVVPVHDLLAALRSGKGSQGDIKIRIESPIVRWHNGDAVLATYEEWQDHDNYTTARQSTVLFTTDQSAPLKLLWRHVQETWLQPPPNQTG